MTTYGIGLDPNSGEYYVVVDGTRRHTFPTCAAAVAYCDEHKEWKRAQAALVKEGA